MRSLRIFVLPGLIGIAIAVCAWRINGATGRAQSSSRPLSSFDGEAGKLLAEMTLDEKIGQMIQPDQMYLKSIDDIEKYHLGSLLSGGDSDPKSGNDLKSWTALYEQYQARALKTRLRIPLLYGVDAVHGHNNVLGATIVPHNIGLGCTRDAALVERLAQITAEEVRATGINWAFAPCVAAPQDIRWGRTYEGFSEDPDIIKPLGAAAVRGLQHGGLSNPEAVLACAKHFAGDGGTTLGTGIPADQGVPGLLDQGDTRVNEATFFRLHLTQYEPAIAAGVASIMPSYSSWNGLKASGNKHLLTEILKQKMGFQGFLISDYKAVDQLPGDYKNQIEQSINAGMDMVMIPERYELFFDNLKALVNENRVPLARIDDAVRRILRVKVAMRLMDPKLSAMADPKLQASFGSQEHRETARQAVRESLVLLKNDKQVLPIAKSAPRIHVAGKSADNIGNQCGGWTIFWQGKTGDVIKGTTVLQAFREQAGPGVNVTFSEDGSGAEGATAGVVVIGETPYAEMKGDRKDLHLSVEDVAAIENVKKAGVPVVAVILSGRPLLIDNILDKADAIVAAWLPGTEGRGVTDVLYGDYKPTGKLSFTWPKAASTSFHHGDPGYQTLFALGFGLSY